MKKFFFIFILVSVGILCFSLGRYAEEKSVIIKEIHDTIPGEIPTPVIKLVPIPQIVDTAAIQREHFVSKTYHDTILIFPNLKLQLNDVSTRNSLVDRQVVVDWRKPEKPCTNRNALIIDTYFTDGSMPVMLGIRKNRLTYKLGYDLFNDAFLVGISIDLLRW